MRGLHVIAGGLLMVGIAISTSFLREAVSSTESSAAIPVQKQREPAHESTPKAVEKPRLPAKPPVTSVDYRGLLRIADDYRQFVGSLRTKADGGDAEAQYYSAAALRYCRDNLRRFFLKPQGGMRTLDEAQSRWARRPEGYRNKIADAHHRCRGYLEDFAEADAWSDWLDKAVAAQYPKAQSMKAEDLRSEHLAAERSETSSVHDGQQDTEEYARELAIESLRTGEPEPIFAMSSWVDRGKHSAEEYSVLASAWQLLACQRGFDCGPNSEWLRTACNYDVQCAQGATVEDYLQRQMGAQFDEARKAASEIGRVVDTHSWDALKDYL